MREYMTRPICAITGATGGIGAALSIQAAREGYDLILHGRSEAKLTELIEKLKQTTPESNVQIVVGELDTAEKTKKMASEISACAPKLDLLFNNAGVLLDGIQMSDDGLEMHTQINLIAPYILMQALKSNVAKAEGSITNVSSGSALRAQPLSAKTLVRPHEAKKLTGAYASSKLALSSVTNALGDAFAEDGVTLVSADPGPNKTGMTVSGGMPKFLLLLRPFIYSSPEKGAHKIFDATNFAKTRSLSGAFLVGRKVKQLPESAQTDTTKAMLLDFCNIHADISELNP